MLLLEFECLHKFFDNSVREPPYNVVSHHVGWTLSERKFDCGLASNEAFDRNPNVSFQLFSAQHYCRFMVEKNDERQHLDFKAWPRLLSAHYSEEVTIVKIDASFFECFPNDCVLETIVVDVSLSSGQTDLP